MRTIRVRRPRAVLVEPTVHRVDAEPDIIDEAELLRRLAALPANPQPTPDWQAQLEAL